MRRRVLTTSARVRFGLALVSACALAWPAPVRAGGVAPQGPAIATPPARLHMLEIARRLHHPASTMPLDAFRSTLRSTPKYALLRTLDDRVVRVQTGLAETHVSAPGSQFYRQLAARLTDKPWTLIPGISVEQLERPHPWSAPANGNDWYAHMRADLISTFAQWSDPHGVVDLERVRRDLGDGSARTLIDTLTSRPISEAVRIPSHRLLAYLSPEARKAVMEPLRSKIVPDGMRVLGWMSRRYAPEFKELAKRQLKGLQHVVGNTSKLLQETGIPMTDIELWGKPHSLEAVVAYDLAERGALVRADEFERDRPQFIERLRAQLRGIDPSTAKPRQIVLLDDGGELISAVAELVRTEFPGHAGLFTSAEQTTKGIKKLRPLSAAGLLPFPVVDIASSWVKRKWGSPMFGYAIASESQRVVEQYAQKADWRPKTMVAIGYGAIGRAAVAGAQRLEKRRVIIVDPDPARRRQAIADGFEVAASKEAALPQAELLISTVGDRTLSDEELPLLPKQAIVINGASAKEFSLTEADRTLNRVSPHHPIDENHQAGTFHDFSAQLDLDHVVYNIFDSRHPPAPGQRIAYATSFKTFEHEKAQALALKKPDQIVIAAKGGGVANFPQSLTGSFGGSATPGRYIQLDIGLLGHGLLQAIAEDKAGIVALDHKRQRDLVSFVEHDLRRQGQSLKRPAW